jgi:glucosamine--fructose-6-phosphate aminotransferase (isomerizing)
MSLVESEIREQAEVLARLVRDGRPACELIALQIRERAPRYVVIAARGSSDNAARYAQYLFGAHNRLPVCLATPSLFTLYEAGPNLAGALVLGVSQSGRSPDIVAVVEAGRRDGALTVAITNEPDSPLARAAEHVLALGAGPERAVAATKTYTASLGALAMLSAALEAAGGRWQELARLPELVTRTLAANEALEQRVVRYRYAEQFVVVGRGFNYSTAFEIALKMKETSYLVAEPYSPADLLHGPVAMIDRGFPALLVAPSGRTLPDIAALMDTLERRHAELVMISDDEALLARGGAGAAVGGRARPRARARSRPPARPQQGDRDALTRTRDNPVAAAAAAGRELGKGMDADQAGGRGERGFGRVLPSALCVLALLALQLGAVSEPVAHWTSDLLQLALAAAAGFACFRTARHERARARWFFGLIGLGMTLWSLGQTLYALRPLGPNTTGLVIAQYLLFVSSTAPLIAACVVRPDRPRPGALGLAADIALVSVLALYGYIYFPIARLALGTDPYQDVAPVFYNPQRLILLVGLLWLLRGSSAAWRRLYEQFAFAMVVFNGGGLISNLAIFTGRYRPGLYDLPWALPFVWLAQAAIAWAPRQPAGPVPAAQTAWEASEWRAERQGNVVALGAVALVPALHQATILLGSPGPELAGLRSRIAFVATLLVGGLYLARRLQTLRRAEATQESRERRFRALVENSADAIGVVDASERLAYVSASAERVTGYGPDELVGRSPLELVADEQKEAMHSALAQVRRRARAEAHGFVRYRHQDGTLRHGAIQAVNRSGMRAVGGVVLHLRDVTAQRQAEQERERSLSLLQATLESTADGILVVDLSGGIASYNQKFVAMWRLGETTLDSYDRVLAAQLDLLKEPAGFLEKVRAIESRLEAESFDTLLLKDGRAFDRYSLPQRRPGEVIGRVWSFRDVTERARAEREMARLVAILEATPDFVAIADAAGRPLYVNRAGRRMVGLAEGEPLEDRHIAEFHTAGAAARVFEQAIPTALREGSWSGESRLRRPDGREIPVLEALLAHRSAGGSVDFLSTVARDISQRLAAELELRRSHTMAALGSLVAGVAHEVRNPLFGISSTLDAFDARFGAQEGCREYVRVFREQLDRLTALMNDLLEYGKPTRLRLEPGRFEDVVALALETLEPIRERAGVAIEARVADELPALRMDERRLGQVLRNLLENAVQHSPAGGHVTLEARLESDAWLACSVEDAGPGFEPHDLPHLFEPFFTKRRGGTGLGLSIVQRIVADHGGRIEAQNRPQGGARFTVRLPVAAVTGDGA